MPDHRQTYFEAVGFFLALVERIRDDQWTAHGLGVWTVRELVVHTLDIAAALGLEVEPPAAPLAVTLNLTLELAARRAAPTKRAALLRALTGRAPLPTGFTVL